MVEKHGVKCYKEDICKSWLAQSGHLSAAVSSWLKRKKEQKRGINQAKGKSERIEACSYDGRILLQVED